MDALEIADFLSARKTGVLALGKENRGYGLPVSFTYDEAGPDLYFRFAFGSTSRKREFVDACEDASFVVYENTEDGWQSVIARGPLVEEAGTNVDSAIVESVRSLDIPYFSVHSLPAKELEFAIFRMDIEDLSGIVESQHFE